MLATTARKKSQGPVADLIVAMDRRRRPDHALKSISLILHGKGWAPPWELPWWFS
jgi:hypothetical protein